MTRTELRAVIEETLSIQEKNAAYRRRRPPAATMRPPVSDTDLAALEALLAERGLALPPSFRTLLLVSDGVPNYMQAHRLSLRGAREIVASSESDEEWDDFEPLHKFVFASGQTGDFVAFDGSAPASSGELPVVLVDSDGSRTRYADLPEFLLEQLDVQRNVLETNLANRAGLPDD